MQDVLRQIDPGRIVGDACELVRIELVDGVERLNLHAGLRVELFRRNAFVDRCEGCVGAGIAIAEWGSERMAVGIEANVIDCPAGDADAGDTFGGAFGAGVEGGE